MAGRSGSSPSTTTSRCRWGRTGCSRRCGRPRGRGDRRDRGLCRQQIHHGTQRTAQHPMELVLQASPDVGPCCPHPRCRSGRPLQEDRPGTSPGSGWDRDGAVIQRAGGRAVPTPVRRGRRRVDGPASPRFRVAAFIREVARSTRTGDERLATRRGAAACRGYGAPVSDASRLLLVVNRPPARPGTTRSRPRCGRCAPGADVEVAPPGRRPSWTPRRRPGRTPARRAGAGDGSVHAVARALDRAGALDPPSRWASWPAAPATTWRGPSTCRWTPEEGAAVVLAGRPRPLDLLADDAGGLVVNAVHAGVGAGPARRPTGSRNASRGGRPTLWARLLPGVSSGGWPLRVEVDGRGGGPHPGGGLGGDGPATC
jgi:hypothetical protein